MTMKTKILLCLCALLGLAAADATRRLTMVPKVRVTAKVVDEIDYNFDLFKTVYKLYELENPTTEPIYSAYPTSIKL